jgi:serine/threonine protein kinase
MLPKFPPGFSHPLRIGTGAFASVYRVRQTALERWVALKFVFEKNPTRRHELLKEAQTQAKLHAECVPQIYDAFEWRQSVCMVMEWIRGVSLADLLTAELSVDDRMLVAGSLIRSLAAIHAQGFAHRDLKPENVLVAPGRGLFLVDFGFSKHIAERQMSSVNVAKGTPAYMAPELWSKGGQVDLMRADVYAAGKVLVQILEGCVHEDFTRLLLKDNPVQRPATGTELLALWENRGLSSSGTADWQRIAGDLVAARLSDGLLAGARLLQYAHRSEEAYWLLVESLEENGNNGEAVELMATFQSSPGRRRTIVQYALFTMILLVGIAAAYLLGSGSRSRMPYKQSDLYRQRVPKLSSMIGTAAPVLQVTLREDTLRTDKLSGRLLVRNIPPETELAVDARKISADSISLHGVYLHRGEHLVSLHDRTGRIIRQERVGLLPFQTKVVDLSSAIVQAGGD